MMKKALLANRRKNYFIKRKFQTRFILKFCLLIILACLLMGIAIYAFTANTVTTSFDNLRLVVKSTKDFILPSLLLSSLIAVIIVSVACISVILFISHRIAGPLYHLERSMKQIAEGDLTVRTRFREGDEIGILASSLNNMVEKIKESIGVFSQEAEALDSEINDVREKLSAMGISRDKIDEILRPYEMTARRLNEGFLRFKVK